MRSASVSSAKRVTSTQQDSAATSSVAASTSAGRRMLQPTSRAARRAARGVSVSIRGPNGYCGLGGTGVSCPIGVGVAASGD